MSFISIRKKLMFMMGTICALFGIALAFILFFAIDQSRQAEALQKEISPLATQLKERGDAYQVQLSALRGYLLQHDQVEFDKFNSMSKELEDAKDKLLSNPNVSESMKNTMESGSTWRKYIEEKVFPLAKEQKWDEALQVAYAENGTVYKVIGDFTNYSNEQAKLRDQSIKKIDQSSLQIEYVVFLSLVICIIVAMILAWWFSGKLVKPIQQIDSKLKELSSQEGDLTARLQVNSNDEIGTIATSFNKMLENLQHIINRVQKTSVEVQNASENMLEKTNISREATIKVQSSMSNLNESIQSQASSMEESSTAMDDMAVSVQRIAESASSVTELAVATSEQANDGSSVIQKSVSQMTTIHDAVNATSEVVERLITHTKYIDTAVQSISNIAEQTNLLALNASIEAARAGEQGKGFAVVADEVRKLAEQSKTAATDINQLLHQIQQDTETASSMMSQGRSEAFEGIHVIREAGNSFTTIVEQVNKVSTQMQDISATAEEMAASAEEMNASLNNIASISTEVSSETAATAQSAEQKVITMNEMTQTAKQMKQTVEELDQLVSHFKTE
ncbi:TPA: methyl-accepting chemotaxis protein [Bacillus cereus]|uniref:Methyl-accepting chemotaxis (MCP) signaling domain protein n=4 Tax=Bacteria TaxID=2 RepID=A0AAN0W5W4_BACCE|nr:MULTISPECIES: methyl-accepting chemotaxis protein [Bacillus cereus group]ABK87769.1 methyl-accepting chemotaxis protein [Bacillus thuringiensis str. Al Hakam]ACO30504.1 methyl-accepting chemotaxis protein [Bacillus cereus 03BB102]AJG55480.1 methyl-accepting chemotaxis (MCP) signaling domain protein [Bacillus cereus 03BB102]AJH69868.1 methyl-accepting chemotaxis (MCP) signaling domain protein [Bacillus thuringiensis]AJI09944.1 methyl-accepting chemotaxis (MCP) signaling domain protein [Bacil